jgi:hypothetical protein
MSNEFPKKSERGQFNSVQLNIVTFVDVYKAIATKTLAGNLYMMDNSLDSDCRGTAHLKTTCKQNQVLNWIIYPMDMDRRIDGSWPPMVKINNIVFLSEDSEKVVDHRVCTEFKVYGGPDKIRSKETPVYYYWAGTVLSELPPDVYNYRFVLELEQEGTTDKLYLNTVEKPSLKVITVEKPS